MNVRTICAVCAAALLAAAVGCELTSLPVVIDASALADTLRVDIDPPVPPVILGSARADLGALMGSLEIADSIHFYDLTLQCSPNASDSAAALTGILSMQRPGSLQHDTLVTFSGARIADFGAERSIFSTSVAGYQYNPRGVGALAQLLRGPQPLPTVTLTMQAIADRPSLHFTLRVRVAAQVFTSP